jgi:Zn-dependent peptidase ImmA (M78 family)/DNA-binding XRE family transcriptional regulator
MTSSFNHNLILLGRQLRKISQFDLAKSASITQGHLSKIENGLSEPSEAIAKRIADILSLPQNFFYQPDRIYGLPISFHPMHRKKASVGQHALEYIHAELNIRLMHIRRLLKSVTLKKEFPIPTLDVDEYDKNIEKIAGLVRRTWLLSKGPLRNLTECLEQAGCLVIWCNFSDSSIDGISFSIPDLPPCIFLNQNQPADRMRFTLAHELGHLIMHRVPTLEMEDQAYKFASSLLMPYDDIRGSFSGKITLPRLAALKPIWRVSIQSLIMRAAAMGIISAAQSRYLWQQISSAKLRFQEPPELDFPHEEPKLLPTIFKMHIDQLGYSLDELAEVLNMFPSELVQMYPFLKDIGSMKKNRLRVVS